ncbi:RNA-binding motif protein, X-linked 2 [Porphyridium purpureum]|uniref:RNA-binding motif protein, X-linked 2 n=1 Tax=Porphyridium purpureum TaxID=35688 RepID=A0A5J4YT74_PORPP|nr:RNA-binding motif protein, X-linked 2 [Porphyridium purpureum]|eukprot:POR2312..scf229_5
MLSRIRAQEQVQERELLLGIAGTSASWHEQYAHSRTIYIGGLQPHLSASDIGAVFEQYGAVEHVHIVKDRTTGEPRGFGFLTYVDQRSTVLAVDNLNGIELAGQRLFVNHADHQHVRLDDGTNNASPQPMTSATVSDSLEQAAERIARAVGHERELLPQTQAGSGYPVVRANDGSEHDFASARDRVFVKLAERRKRQRGDDVDGPSIP